MDTLLMRVVRPCPRGRRQAARPTDQPEEFSPPAGKVEKGTAGQPAILSGHAQQFAQPGGTWEENPHPRDCATGCPCRGNDPKPTRGDLVAMDVP